jgi:hypothetical protein
VPKCQAATELFAYDIQKNYDGVEQVNFFEVSKLLKEELEKNLIE